MKTECDDFGSPAYAGKICRKMSILFPLIHQRLARGKKLRKNMCDVKRFIKHYFWNLCDLF